MAQNRIEAVRPVVEKLGGKCGHAWLAFGKYDIVGVAGLPENTHCRRLSAPPRKMAADPVHYGGQAVPVRMSAFLRHISIMHLLSLGYEPYDVHLSRLRCSGVSG